jgi:hypothetical protein
LSCNVNLMSLPRPISSQPTSSRGRMLVIYWSLESLNVKYWSIYTCQSKIIQESTMPINY